MLTESGLNQRYEIRERIGQGGMGEVYRAWDKITARDVTIKTLRDHHNDAALEQFRNECRVLASLNHANIVDIYDLGDIQGRPYFVMPLLPGDTLAALSEKSRLPVERVVDIIFQACRGLQAAHERGLLHRDLKPSNIFVLPGDSVKIIDFGIAGVMDKRSTMHMRGTLLYMSPEQTELKTLSPRSDLFSLAVVCYEALTRQRPFSGANAEATVHAIRHEAATPASELNPAVNQSISQVLHKALAKQPSLRFRSIREFGACLQKALREEPIEYFDEARLGLRLDRVRQAIDGGESDLASEVLEAIEAETYHPDVVALRRSIDKSVKQSEIRRLLAGARRRLDLGEHQLALQRVRKALDIDSSHPEALGLQAEIENRGRGEQFKLWLGLARKHIDNNAFQHAREALDKVLAGDSTSSQGLELLAELERREQQYNRLQNEKRELYRQALEDVRQGELTGSLSKLERVIELDGQAPDTMAPERQKIFDRVQSQHRELNDCYERAVRLRSEKKTAEAFDLCDQVLAKHPGHALFSALKLDLESDQTQQLSAYIAEIDAALDAEQDLGRRLEILAEAVERYPSESRFQQRLHSTKGKADLVQSVVLRARGYEKDGKFVEALAQWETLRTVYSQYPGLDLEIGRVAKRREIQSRSQAKQRWVEQVEQARKSGDWGRAEAHVEEALAEVPGDPELEELRKMTSEGKQRANQARELVQAAKTKLAQGEGGKEAVELLRQAHQLDSRNLLVRNTFLDALLKRAQSLLDEDWRAAEPYARQASELNPESSAASGLLSLIGDRKQEEEIDRWASEARRQERAGDLEAAVRTVRRALSEHPSQTRLQKLERSLSEELTHQARTTRNDNPKPEPRPTPSIPADFARADAPTLVSGADAAAAQTPVPAIDSAPKTRRKRSSIPLWGAVAATLAAGALLGGWLWSRGGSPSQASSVAYQIVSNPAGARVLIDGGDAGTTPISASLAPGAHRIELIREGYFRLGENLDVNPLTDGTANRPLDLAFMLEPIPGELHLSADLEQAEATLDGETKVALEEGRIEPVNLSSARHRLELSARGGLRAALDFRSEPGQAPELIGPPRTSNLQATIVAGLGNSLRLWASDLPAQASVDGESRGELGVDGLLIEDLEPGVHEIAVETGDGARTLLARLGATPTLTVFLAADRDVGDLYITSNETEDVSVLVDGRSRRYRARDGRIRIYGLPAGARRVSISKEGFRAEPATQSARITKGEVASLRFRLVRLASNGTLSLRDAPAGVEVLIDGESIGVADEAGSLTKGGLALGEHLVELRGKGYRGRSVRKRFSAEAPTVIQGGEASLMMSRGTLRLEMNPPGMALDLDPAVIDAGRFEGRTRYPEAPRRMELQTGIYNLTFSVPGRGSHTVNIQLAEGETKTIPVTLSLDGERPLTSGDPMRGWDKPEAWTANDGWYVRRGAAYALFDPEVSRGVFRFTTRLPAPVIGSGKPAAWVVGYKNRGDFLLFEVNKRTFSRSRLVGGKSQDERSAPHGLDAKQEQSFEVEVRDNQVECRVLVDSRPKILDSWEVEVGAGRFGFWIPGGKELEIRGFSVRGR